MKSFSFSLSGKLCICSSIQNDIFAGQSNLGYRSLIFMILNIFCQSLLACKVSSEKSADSLMETHLQVTNLFSLAAFKILSLSLTFGILIMICLGVGLFASMWFGTLCASWTCMSIPSPNYGSFLSLFFQIDFLFFALSLFLLAPL